MEKTYSYRPLLFFVLAYAGAWIPWLAGAHLGSHATLQSLAGLFSLLGLILGPAAATLILVFGSGNAALKRDFKERLFDIGRVRGGLALFAVAMPAAVILSSIALSLLLGESTDQFRLASGAGLIAMIPLALLFAPLMEELGWHGYGVDSLRDKMGMMRTTALFAVLWSAWHAPLVLVPGSYQNALAGMENPIYLANFFASVIPAAIIANWFYYKNGRSILASVLLHSMLNAPSVLINAGQTAKIIATLLYAAVAAALIVRDAKLFAEGPRNFLDAG